MVYEDTMCYVEDYEYRKEKAMRNVTTFFVDDNEIGKVESSDFLIVLNLDDEVTCSDGKTYVIQRSKKHENRKTMKNFMNYYMSEKNA